MRERGNDNQPEGAEESLRFLVSGGMSCLFAEEEPEGKQYQPGTAECNGYLRGVHSLNSSLR